MFGYHYNVIYIYIFDKSYIYIYMYNIYTVYILKTYSWLEACLQVRRLLLTGEKHTRATQKSTRRECHAQRDLQPHKRLMSRQIKGGICSVCGYRSLCVCVARVSYDLLFGTRVFSSVSRKRQTCRQAPSQQYFLLAMGLCRMFLLPQAFLSPGFAFF